MIFCHCPFVEFFQRNRLVFMVEFQKLHFCGYILDIEEDRNQKIRERVVAIY